MHHGCRTGAEAQGQGMTGWGEGVPAFTSSQRSAPGAWLKPDWRDSQLLLHPLQLSSHSRALRDTRLLRALASESSQWRLVVRGSSPGLAGRWGRKRRLFTRLGCPAPPPACTSLSDYCSPGTALRWLPEAVLSHLFARRGPRQERKGALHSRCSPKSLSPSTYADRGRDGTAAPTSSCSSRSSAVE